MAHYCAKTEQNTLSKTAADGFTEHYIIRLLSACEPPTTNIPSPTALVLSVVNEINNLIIVFMIFRQRLQLLQSLQSIRRQLRAKFKFTCQLLNFQPKISAHSPTIEWCHFVLYSGNYGKYALRASFQKQFSNTQLACLWINVIDCSIAKVQMAQLITSWTYWNTGDPGLNPSWILVFFHHTLQYLRLRQSWTLCMALFGRRNVSGQYSIISTAANAQFAGIYSAELNVKSNKLRIWHAESNHICGS